MVWHHIECWESTAGENLIDHELDEACQLYCQWQTLCGHLFGSQDGDGVQQHHSVSRHRLISDVEELVVAVEVEVLERADRHDPVNLAVEFFPATQLDRLRALARVLVEKRLNMGGLILAQGQADDIDVVLVQGSVDTGTPAAADIQQRHPRLQTQLAERQVNLCELRLFE